ncbi:hypothetical protein ASD79_01680 [Caulobacter sp. Root655]|nr:hypothetical protein ASD79_01680 [Caulobacter sp. Root655]
MIADLGWCINSYGQIEYLVADLLWHAWQMPEYSKFARMLPMGLDQRAKLLRQLLTEAGPLSAHATDLNLLMGRLDELSEPRHMFVHGHTTFLHTAGGDAAFMFRRFVPPEKGGDWTKYEGIVRPAQLGIARQLWCVFASTAQRIIGNIYVELELEKDRSGGVTRAT